MDCTTCMCVVGQRIAVADTLSGATAQYSTLPARISVDLSRYRTASEKDTTPKHMCWTTAASEIARTMITWSGATIIPDIPEYYRKYPTLLEFLSAEKQPWQESITLDGEIGEYIVMARQNRDGQWLIAAASNETARKLSIPLSFLPKKSHFTAAITTDAADTNFQTNREGTAYREEAVTEKSVITVDIASGGGCCILLK